LNVAHSINGITTGNGGWAIRSAPGTSNPVDDEIAVYELVTTLSSPHGYDFTFVMYHDYGYSLIPGKFRISVTSDDRSTFADGLITGGDVTANWTVLDITSLSATNGVTLTAQGDGSILVGGTIPLRSTYTLSGTYKETSGNTDITGIRIEVFEDSSMPSNGPGHYSDGNLVLTEFTADFTEVYDPGYIDGDLQVTEDAGIGIAPISGYRLAVDGAVRARSITVDSASWADFVFDEDYELSTLSEVEAHIAEHGHLPEIPSEAEVMERGIDLAAMQVKLLQKIEELTLHTIRQEKELQRLAAENCELKKQFESSP
jgi:hypothetical protein